MNLVIASAYSVNSYLDDDEATRAAFTSDGFYKTGDNAHLVDGEYIIDGRSSSDCKCIDRFLPQSSCSKFVIILNSCTISRLQGPYC